MLTKLLYGDESDEYVWQMCMGIFTLPRSACIIGCFTFCLGLMKSLPVFTGECLNSPSLLSLGSSISDDN